MVTRGSGERHALRVGATSASALRCTPRPDLTCREYNEERPKKSLGGLTPTLYVWKLTSKRRLVTAELYTDPPLKTGGRRYY